ncbi:cytochrome P450 4B1-like [Clavelina lepadiformis]|uniref:cytochrome P450 4B1-like n=1 Tax=Clavelina lepadiformis TaxID=159417 RepID=UPI0040418669
MIQMNPALYLSVALVSIVLLVKYLTPWYRLRKQGQKAMEGIIGQEPHWLFGTLTQLQLSEASFLDALKQLNETGPKIVPLWMGPFLWYLVLVHPHVVKPLLETAEPKDEIGYGFLRPWIGDGLLVSKGKKWHRNRHLLTRAFHFDILKGYMQSFNSCATTMLDIWDSKPRGRTIEMFKPVSLMALDNMLQCTMSFQTGCQTDSGENKYIKAVFEMGETVMKRVFNPLVHPDFLFYLTPRGRRFKAHCDYVHEFDEKIIAERKAYIQKITSNSERMKNDADENQNLSLYMKMSKKNLDFLDILLLTKDEDGKGLSDREIRDEVDTFLFEGHDTTASALSWAFYCFATYPECQEKCRTEVQKVLGNKKYIEWNDLAKLSYLTMFIKEVLRLYPPVFTMARKLSNPLTINRGFGEDQFCQAEFPPPAAGRTLGPGSSFNTPMFMLHRNAAVWPDPEVFDPLRFTPDNSKGRSPYAHLPFSAGPRNCIGQKFAMAEMKVTLSKALQRFRFYIDEECPKPEIQFSIVLKAKKGIHIKVDAL